LRALGTDPVRKLVLPRMLAGLIMVPVLTAISVGVGMIGTIISERMPCRAAAWQDGRSGR